MTSTAAPTTPRRRDPEGTRAAILAAAEREFSARGYHGGRVDAVAENTATTKRMIYYYFGDKRGLYLATLEHVYRSMREQENAVRVGELDPVAGVRTLVEATFDFQESRTSFVRMVAFENTLDGANIAGIDSLRELNRGVITTLERLLERGRAAGLFRTGPDAPDAHDLHQLISSLTFFRVSNRATFREVFDYDMLAPERRESSRRRAVEVVLTHVLA